MQSCPPEMGQLNIVRKSKQMLLVSFLKFVCSKLSIPTPSIDGIFFAFFSAQLCHSPPAQANWNKFPAAANLTSLGVLFRRSWKMRYRLLFFIFWWGSEGSLVAQRLQMQALRRWAELRFEPGLYGTVGYWVAFDTRVTRKKEKLTFSEWS